MPCPLCGGLIHPVAGRCKHCKADLTSLRGARPQATAPLPPLGAGAAPAFVAPPPVATAIPVPIAAHEPSQPVLPPRPTARSFDAPRPRPAWRQWPVLVIALAVVAIVAAVVILFLPPGEAEGHHALQPPPAPERMDTDSLPDSPDPGASSPGAGAGSPDPWGGQGRLDPRPPPRQVVPPPPSQAPVPDDPADPDDPTSPDDDQIIGQLQQAPSRAGSLAFGGLSTPVVMLAMRHACARLTSCPGIDDDLASICSMVRTMPMPTSPVRCAAAQRCFDRVDHLSCSQMTSGDPMTAVMLLRECSAAATSC